MDTNNMLEDLELDAVVGGGKGKALLVAAGAAATAVGLDLAASAIWDGLKWAGGKIADAVSGD